MLAFYNERRAKAWAAKPNAAHLAIASLEKHFDVVVITQNVDNLHERAGSTNVLHLHGELAFARGTARREAARIDGAPMSSGRNAQKVATAAGHRVVRRRDPAHGRGRASTWPRPTRCWWSELR